MRFTKRDRTREIVPREAFDQYVEECRMIDEGCPCYDPDPIVRVLASDKQRKPPTASRLAAIAATLLIDILVCLSMIGLVVTSSA